MDLTESSEENCAMKLQLSSTDPKTEIPPLLDPGPFEAVRHGVG